MLKKTATQLFLLCLTTLPFYSLVYAAGTGPVKIVWITNQVGPDEAPNESLLILTNETNLLNPAGCSQSDRYEMLGSDISRSMILTALAAGSTVSIAIHDNLCSISNRPKVSAVSIKQN